MDVTITISGTSPNYSTSNDPAPPYNSALSVTFYNSTSSGVTVYYKLPNAGFTQSQNVSAGANSNAISAGAGSTDYNVVSQGSANPIGWTHVIHVGSGVP